MTPSVAYLLGLESVGLLLWMDWEWALFPFRIAVKRPSLTFIAAWPPVVGSAIGLAFWFLVAAAFGWLTRRLTAREQAILAPLMVAAGALLAHIVLGVAGYTLQQDGP